MNFTDILNKKSEDVKPPKSLPVGTYLWAIPQPPRNSEIADGKFDALDFELVCLMAKDDVDQSALAEFGPVQGTKRRLRFLFDKNDQGNADRSVFYLNQFLTDHLGIEAEGKTIQQMLAEVPGRQVNANIVWRADTRPGSDRIFDEIRNTSKAD